MFFCSYFLFRCFFLVFVAGVVVVYVRLFVLGDLVTLFVLGGLVSTFRSWGV